MIRRSIVMQFWTSVVGLTLLVLLVLGLAADIMLMRFFYRQRVEQLLEDGRQFARALAIDPWAQQNLALMADIAKARIAIVDREGNWAFTGFDTGHPSTAIDAARLRDVLPGGSVAGLNLIYGGQRHFGVLVPIGRPDGPRGVLILMAPQASVQLALGNLRKLLGLAAVGAIILFTGLAFLLSRRLARPLLQMQRAAQAVGRGDYSVRVAAAGFDEVGQLAHDLNRMTDALENYERTRQELFANVSHELRTPLSHIRGYSQALAEEMVDSAEDKVRYLTVIRQEAERLSRLVDNLMDVAQLEESGLPLHRQPVDVPELARAVVAQVRPRAEAAGIVITADFTPNLPLLSADPDRLRQVLINLLDNALQHTPAGGRVNVLIRRAEGSGLELTVSDTGAGIPPEALPQVFDRFYRADPARPRLTDGGGRGLGLAIVRSIVRAHGGQVTAQSRPGQGTAIRCRLPFGE